LKLLENHLRILVYHLMARENLHFISQKESKQYGIQFTDAASSACKFYLFTKSRISAGSF
jgi:hypothetical protein